MNYTKERKAHLASYAKSDEKIKNAVPGVYNYRGREVYEPHILTPAYNKEEKLSTVCKYNILQSVNSDIYRQNSSHMHRFAHHLNSSQVMCYNYFRPYLDNLQSLSSLLNKYGIPVSSNLKAEFEYNDGYKGKNNVKEKTEFDFHILDKNTGIEVFFEIKYTEGEFGKWGSSASEDNFKIYYSKMIKACSCLKKPVKYDNRFVKDYQLFRNIFRVNAANKYSIFIFPKNDTRLVRQFNSFVNDYVKESSKKTQVQYWYWEDLLKGQEETDFYMKYLQ